MTEPSFITFTLRLEWEEKRKEGRDKRCSLKLVTGIKPRIHLFSPLT